MKRSGPIRRTRMKRPKVPKVDDGWQQARLKVIERARGLCEGGIRGVCVYQGHHVHHRKLRSQGGGHTLDNLMLLCHPCHDWAHKNPRDAAKLGLIIRVGSIEQ